MPKKNQPDNTTKRSAKEKINDTLDAVSTENQNQTHNTKKESLGPNTRR